MGIRAALLQKSADSLSGLRRTVRIVPVSADASEFTALVDSQHVPVPAEIMADTVRRGVQGRVVAVASYLISQHSIMKREIPALRAAIVAKDSAIYSLRKGMGFKDAVIAEKDAVIASNTQVIDNSNAMLKDNTVVLRKVVRKKNGAIIGGSIGGLLVGIGVGAVVYAVLTRK
jgi:hypothetical protein